ncbi:hypothetical protein ACFFRR_003526 [Megaselia abdita]
MQNQTEVVEVPQIKELEELVAPHLNGSKITSYTSKYLTKPGENYGSCMIAVTAKVETSDGKEESLEMVAKMPPLADFFFKIFCPERTFRTENSIYLDLVPALESIEKQLDIPTESSFVRIFPKSYGGRVNCNNDVGPVDRDALLVLENLVISGFKPGTRSKFFGLEDCKFVLKNLAKFHASSIVLRKLKPTEFQKIVNDNFKKFDMEGNMDDDYNNDFTELVLSDIKKATNNNEKVLKRYNEFTEISKASNSDGIECEDGPYSAICHYDFWINNMMIKYDPITSTPIDIKIVDFQISQYNSAARDVFFFLFSSVEIEVLRNHYQDLLKVYFDSLVDLLQIYGCSTEEYNFDSFLKEVKDIAPLEVPHAIFMLKVVMAEVKVENDDFSKLDESMFMDENANLVGLSYFKRIQDNFELLEKFGYL